MEKLVLFLASFAFLASAAWAADDPVAAPGAVVTSGNARFTVLTDRLIRMEWSEDGVFEDRASLAIINRNNPLFLWKRSRRCSRLRNRQGLAI